MSERCLPPFTATDLIVRTRNPEFLDQTVQQLGAAAVVEGSYNGDTCRVRVFGNPGYMKFAITNQGYGEIVGEEPAMSERRLPLDGQVLASTDFNDSYDTDDRTIVTDLEQANLITSMIAGSQGVGTSLHKVVIDIDLPVKVIASSTPGHFHLYIDKAMEWETYLVLLRALALAEIIEYGYLAAAERRKYTAVRLPWIRKAPAEKEVAY